MSKARIYAFVSPKGGAGKTITAITLGTVLSELGRSVVLIDTDASTNGLSLFYLDKVTSAKRHRSNPHVELTGAFQMEGQVGENTIPVSENLFLIPASFVLTQTEETNKADFSQRLANILNGLRQKHDYIFLDAQAGTDFFAEIAVGAADEVVVVSEYDPMSVQGIERMKVLFKVMQEKRVWTLFNKVLPEFVPTIGEFLAVANYLVPIAWDADVVRAYVRRRTPIDMESGNTHTLSVMKTVVSLFGSEVEQDVEKWTQAKSDLIRKPVTAKIDELEQMILELQDQKISLKYRPRRNAMALVRTYMPLLAGVSALAILTAVDDDFRSAMQNVINKIFSSNLVLDRYAPLVIVVYLFVFSWFLYSYVRPRFFTRDEENIEREQFSLDLQLEKLQEERSRLLALAHTELGELLNRRERTKG